MHPAELLDSNSRPDAPRRNPSFVSPSAYACERPEYYNEGVGMDFAKLRREDWMVLGGGVVLIIGLLAFAWYSIFGATLAATSSPYAIWGILALIVTIAIVADYALALFSPQTEIPSTKYGRDLTRLGACALLLLLLFIKFISHVGSLGWGFFVDIILAGVVTAGAWLIVQRAATGAITPSSPGSGPVE